MSRRTIASSLVTALLFASTSHADSPRHPDLALHLFYSGAVNKGTLLNLRADEPADSGEIYTGRVILVAGVLAGSMVAVHLYQQQGWWADNRAPFHFEEDLHYGLWADKIGHFYGTTVWSYSIRKTLEWANVPERASLWWGSGGALLFQTFLEIEDGFSTWGFDRVDFAFDLLGAAWPIAQHYAPALQSFNLKLSYHPSPLLGTAGGEGFEGQKHLVFDDYEGQTFWLSMRVHDFLPHGAKSAWPDFLCLAVGYGARNITGANPTPVVFLAPDLDMTRIIPQSSSFLKTLGEALNFIHMPLPAVQISPGAIWYGIYF